MMRSMFSAVSGLKAHQIRMDVIGNNIANVNTAGYKASRMVFQDLFSQTMASASAATGNVGGTNARQVGLGASTGAIDILFGTSAAQTTGRTLDLMIDGDGFFVVHDESAYDAGSANAIVNEGGDDQSGGVRFTRAGNFYVDAEGNLLTTDGFRVLGWLNEDAATNTTSLPESGLSGDLYAMPLEPIRMNIGFIEDEEGGHFTEVAIDDKGVMTAIYNNDQGGSQKVYIAKLAVASFPNQEGLEKVGNNLYRDSNNSGDPIYAAPGTFGAPMLNPGCLEMSNVDLADSFTDMIITQRGFQANSRTITTTDSMLEELVNLKR